ncbi:MAG: nucleotidyltransferase family protein [Gemmatimonadota bacterium]|jgi:molybdenum cofactor cytidylyltransferase
MPTSATRHEDVDAGPSIAGVVLAAGRSRRMGQPKPLLQVGGESFISHAVTTLVHGGCRPVFAVTAADATEAARQAENAGARVVLNVAAESEQIDSLRLALAAADNADAVLVLPVDHPLIRSDTVSAIIQAFTSTGRPAVRARFRGKPGHPALFARSLYPELKGPLSAGAQEVLQRYADQVLDVDVDDPGVLSDIDTPDDLRRHLGTTP